MVRAPRTFNMADVWEMAADAVPDRTALVVGDRRLTYAQLEERANRLAGYLAAEGVGPGDHVGLYLENCTEYLEAMLAAYKLRAVSINVNHRYVADELRYLLDNSDAVAVITQPSLHDTVAAVRGAVPAVRFALTTGDGYEAALAAAPPDRPAVERRDDDHYIIYTGGTTGLPKGVVWRQVDAFYACMGGGDPLRMQGAVTRPDELPDRILDKPICYLPLAPMMHAAAQWTSFSWLFAGGKVVLMTGPLDPDAVWRTVAAEQVNLMTVVGDAVARPLLDAWDRAGGYDIPSLYSFSNGGAAMAPATRERVFATLPQVMVTDGFGSSEAGTQGAMRVAAGTRPEGAGLVRFDTPTKPTIVVDLDGEEVEPGSGVVGQVLAGGRLPLGYYNDPEKTAASFVTRDGTRWLVTGDMATVGADGAIELLGRGSEAINTGGEKVFPEEVEGVLKGHPGVFDCLVVGVPDERWGQAVTAVVQPPPGEDVTLASLVAHCKAHMAGYKAPKHLVVVEGIVRSPSGKADYRWARRTAEAATTAP
ncbi:MAG TPA: acyl-CoA synthetase [Acidimicrobiales bacterium]|nr:acyl-CoA synthetase [Acidimicrobiales bacterium]